MRKICLLFFTACSFFSIAFAQQPNIDSLLNVISRPQEDTGKVIAYRMLAGQTLNTNPVKAVVYGKAGAALGKKLGFDKGVAGCLLNIAVAYSSGGKLDSALLYIDTAINWSKKVGEPARIALAFLNKGDYNRQLGNMQQALTDCDTSMIYAERANKDDTKARIYQTIGSVYHAQDNWQQSRLYYEKAYQLYEKVNNKKMMAISMNNLGNVYKHLNKYETSIASYQNAIRLAREINDLNTMAMYHQNLADVYLETGDLSMAEATGLTALQFAREQENEIQLLGAQGVLANVYVKMGKLSQAIQSANESYALATKNELTGERQIAADILSEAYYRTANYKEAYRFMQLSKVLADSVSRKKFDDNVAAMQTKFKVDEKDKEIQLLAKDKELQEQKLWQQWLLMIAAVAVALLIFIGAWMLINRNRFKQKMKELELRNQIAADLHDEVGSSLSSIHMLSQMATKQGSDAVHKDILERMSSNAKETMDKMGDIVWMIKPGETEAGSLKQRMERFAYEICSSKNISATLQIDDLEKIKLTMEQRKNIYLIFKEAVNNAVKYSGTEKIEVIASAQNKELLLQVKDFGKGFDSNIVNKGNGLDNMQHRARELNAMFNVQSTPGAGTLISLSMPV